MSDEENYPRMTITLPPDLAAWVKQKKGELEAKDRRMKTSVSAIIADAVADMKARDESPDTLGNRQPQSASANVIRPFANSAGGSSTAPTKATRQAGKAK
jgi:hypothetical protein